VRMATQHPREIPKLTAKGSPVNGLLAEEAWCESDVDGLISLPVYYSGTYPLISNDSIIKSPAAGE